MLEVDKAYAAGILDGEGYVGIRGKSNKIGGKKYYQLVVKVGMTGADEVLGLLKSTWGGCIAGGGGKDAKQLQWTLYCSMAESFLRDVLPYLVLKKLQVLVALEFQKSRLGISDGAAVTFDNRLRSLKKEMYGGKVVKKTRRPAKKHR